MAAQANTGSADLSQDAISASSSVTLENSSVATGIARPVDMAASSCGQFLYAQSGCNGTVQGFAVNGDGSLTFVGSWTIPDGGSQEGIAAA